MKFNHMVKHNGVYYPAGADVPIENEKGGGRSPLPLNSGKVDDGMGVNSDIGRAEFDKKLRKYSEEDLKLPYMKLKALAKKEGFKIENTMKANELKDMLRSV